MIQKVIKSILIFIALISAVACGYLTFTQEVAVLNKEVKQNAVIKASDITTIRVYKATLDEDEQYIRGTDLVGKSAQTNLPSNTIIGKNLAKEIVNETASINKVTVVDGVIIPIAVDPFKVPTSIKEGDSVKVVIYFEEGTASGSGAFTFGFNTPVLVNKITKNGEGQITKVDVSVNKQFATDIVIASSMGEVFIISDNSSGEIDLSGATPNGLYSKYFLGASQVTVKVGE